MADSSYASEVQAILAFLSLQRTGGGGSGNHPQGPDAASEGLNPYGLVAPRFQRKFKAKQVPEGVGGGNDHGICPPILGPWSSIHRAFLWKATCSVITSPTTSLRQSALVLSLCKGGSQSSRPCAPQRLAQLILLSGGDRVHSGGPTMDTGPAPGLASCLPDGDRQGGLRDFGGP